VLGAKNKRIIKNSNFPVIQYNKNKIPFSYLNLTKSQTTGNFFNDSAKRSFSKKEELDFCVFKKYRDKIN
jgi:hypothetical protein